MPKNIKLLKELAKQRIGKPLKGVNYGIDELSPAWKGSNIGYSALHKWVTRKLGKAVYCSINPNHRALRYEWSNISGEYKRDLGDFRPLCSSCHNKVDKNRKQISGFSYLMYKGKKLEGEPVGPAPWDGIERNDDDSGEPIRLN